jgi:hypothetical protein
MQKTCLPAASAVALPASCHPKPVDNKTRQMGKVLLEAMGVKVKPLKGR